MMMELKITADTRVEWFADDGDVPSKMAFPLFLHPSPLCNSEWVMLCYYHIYEPAPLLGYYIHTADGFRNFSGKRGAVRCRGGSPVWRASRP